MTLNELFCLFLTNVTPCGDMCINILQSISQRLQRTLTHVCAVGHCVRAMASFCTCASNQANSLEANCDNLRRAIMSL